MTLEQTAELVIKALKDSIGGEVFVPRIPSMRIIDLAKAIEPKCKFKIIGIRPGEKIHETLISEDEARKVKIFDGIYVILPQFFESIDVHREYEQYPFVPEGFVYRSDKNDNWLTVEALAKMINNLEK
jgi:UDP-N-acetylglucosamine 4,6-dehydratase